MMTFYFDHEKLKVYQKTLLFISWWEGIKKSLRKSDSIIDQLDRASNSIALNIAEGTGRNTGKDKARFFDIARGSAVESASGLDVLKIKNMLEDSIVIEGKKMLNEIVAMLIGLIKSVANRTYEPESEYFID